MQHSFSIGHTVPLTRKNSSENHSSASRNMQFLSDHLAWCCLEGQTWGPFHTPPFPHVQVSGLGVVPKKNGKFRVIHDISSPHGNSVNDAIPPGVFSLQYESVDTAVNTIMKLGRESYLTNIDIRNAFRLCPVAPADMHLLGIKWAGQYYFERVLPFGLRSSPFIFDKLASAINWIFANTCYLEHVMHYLDDFLDVCLRTFTWLTITRHFSLTHSPICISPGRQRRWKARPQSRRSSAKSWTQMRLKYAVQKTSGSGSIASSLTRLHQQDSSSANLHPC